MKTWRSLAAGIALFPAAMVAADTVVTVGASGATRDQAIESALGDALVEALGTHVFSVTTMTGDQFASMSTAVSGGRIKSFEVLDEIETFDGVHVQLSVELSDADVEGFAPKETVTWADRIEETHGWDHAQRTINQYRGLLDDFLRGPKHQVHAGYAFVLRSYDVDTVDSSSLSGNIYVD